jgi:hypothetical protein
MTKRYWNADDVPATDVLLDWVNQNVVAAIKHFWEDDKPVVWIENKDDCMVITVAGPGIPTIDDPAGENDIYTTKSDLLAELKRYSEPYADIGGPCSDAQRTDMRERAAALRKLAGDILELAARADDDG